MDSPLFESMIANNMSLISTVEESDEATMVVNESKNFALAEFSEEPKYKLVLTDKEIICEELVDLLAYRRIRKVKILELDQNEFGDQGAALIASAEALEKLGSLSLARNDLSDLALKSLAASTTLKRLEKLYLQRNRFGTPGVQALAQSEILSRLEILYLKGNPLGPAGAKALADSPSLRNLTELNLQQTQIGTEGLAALAGSEVLSSVKVLNVSKNGIDAASAADFLAQSACLPNLENLDVYGNGFDDDQIQKIKNSPHLPNLRFVQAD